MPRSVRSVLVLAVVTLGCSKLGAPQEGDPGHTYPGDLPPEETLPDAGTSSATGAKVNLALKLGNDGSLCALGAQCLNAAAIGPNLKSLKVFIDGISICQDLQVNGTATGNATGCLQLFNRAPLPNWPTSGSDLAGQLAAAKASTDGWVDLMDPLSRATLQKQILIQAGDAREYNWGLVSAPSVVKVTATVARTGTPDAGVLYTHEGTAQSCSVNNTPYSCVVSSKPLDQAPAEEAIFAGGLTGWFKFQAPFTISADDVDAGIAFSLDLAFDPDALVQGVTAPGATNFPPLSDNAVGANGADGGANTMSLATVAMAPIAHKSSSKVMKETYAGTVTTSGDTYDLRIELFYLSDDPQKTIYSVNVAAIPNANTQSYIAGAPYAYYLKTNLDGTITLENWDHSANYAGLKRGSQVGDTTVVDVNTGPGATGTTPVTFELKAIGAIQ